MDSRSEQKEKRQKKLLLYTVKELHKKWKKENSQLCTLPGLTFFRSMKPKEFVSAGDPGTHNMCVCAIHENVKLKIYALKTGLTYRDFLAKTVCNVDEKDCMLRQCTKCPKKSVFIDFLKDLLVNNDSTVTFNNWTTKNADGSKSTVMNLQKISQPLSSFIEELTNDLYKLSIHHYTSEIQKEYLNHCKNNLTEDTCIILMDFSENYAFIVQNSVQAWYFNNDNKQATVHPFVVYYIHPITKTVTSISYCTISDYRPHTALTVYMFVEKLVSQLKIDMPAVKNVIFFSDGAPGHYKNK